jgi:hypothetical protein
VIRNWKRFAEAGATTAVQASEDIVPASHLREAYAKIRELAAELRDHLLAGQNPLDRRPLELRVEHPPPI